MSDQSTPKKTPAEFTQREMDVLANAWRCMDSEPKIDTEKLAKLCGYSNPRSATNAMAAIKKKLAAFAEKSGDSTSAATTPKTKATPAKTNSTKKNASTRKRKSGAEEDMSSHIDSDGTHKPAKKARATPRKAKTSEAFVPKEVFEQEGAEEVDGADDGAEGSVNDADDKHVNTNAFQGEEGYALDMDEA